MKRQKHIIWTDDIGDLNDWRDILEDDECTTDDELLWRATDLNDEYLYDEIDNLEQAKLIDDVVIFADLGLWDGRRSGYRCLIADNVGEALYRAITTNDDTIVKEVYVDELGDLRVTQAHHDGANFLTIRVWKNDVSDAARKNLLNKVYYNTATRKDITRCTRSLGPEVAKVYGWR